MQVDPDSLNIRYTLGQAVALNHGKVNLPADLRAIFDSYSMPACALEKPYNNRYNIKFYAPGAATVPRRKQIARKEEVYSDESVLSHLRHAFGSITKDKTVLAVTQLNQTVIPDSMIQETGRLFFNTVVQSPALCQEYLTVLFNIHYQDGKETAIQLEFVKAAMSAFRQPVMLEDTNLESGADRSKKHRSATCLVLAKMFIYNFAEGSKPWQFFWRSDNFTRFMDSILTRIEGGDAADIANLRTIIDIVKGVRDISAEHQIRVRKIAEDKQFKLSTRLLLSEAI
jgi:hypothetical protein